MHADVYFWYAQKDQISHIVHIESENMPDRIRLSHLEQTVYFAALRQGMHVLDVERVRALVKVSALHASKLMAEMARKGALQRVGRGLYMVISSDILHDRKTFVADPFQVVDELLQNEGLSEYYVAYQSAAFIHGATDQLPQALLIALPSQRRPIKLGRAELLFVQVQRAKFFGIEEARYHDSFFRISNREKTLLDCLDRFDLCGGIDEVAHTVGALLPAANRERLLAYIPNMNNQALIHRLGFILEKLSTQLPVAEMLLDDLTNLVTPRVYALDPHGSVAGSIHPRWRVRENTMLALEA